MFQPKDTDWLNVYKTKAHIYAFYKKLTWNPETHTNWKRGDRKRFYGNKKKAGV